MGRKCIVRGCRSGYSSNSDRVSLFSVPKDDDLRAKWVSVIPPTRIPITRAHVVCEKHFLDSDIERRSIHRDSNGKIIANVAYSHPKLKKDAIPTIFQLKQAVDLPKDIRTEHNSSVAQSVPNTDKNNDIAMNESPLEQTDCAPSLKNETLVISLNPAEGPKENNWSEQDIRKDNNNIHSEDNMACENNFCQPEHQVEVSSSLKDSFSDLFDNADAINIPPGWFRYTSSNSEKWIAFSTFEKKQTEPNLVQPLPRKSVMVLECGNVYASANGKTILPTKICQSLESIDNVEQFSRFLSTFATVGLCSGVQLANDLVSQFRVLFQDPFGQWRHKDCSIVSNNRTCDVCQKLKRSITQKKRRTDRKSESKQMVFHYKTLQEKSKIIALRKRLRSQRESVRRARVRITKLKDVVLRAEKRMRHLNDQSIVDKCAELNLSNAQQLCIQEIITAARAKNPHGHRFTEDWVMLCMLMHTRSPAHYRLLLKNDILPLPTPRTIRRYFSIINTKCGFDEKILRAFPETFGRKTIDGKARHSANR